MRHVYGWSRNISLCLGLLALSGILSPLRAQNVQVTSANPPAAPQCTQNLNVTIGGNGFKKGAHAKWYLSGTFDPAGVTVNSTAFNSPSQLTANISAACDAKTGSFDVVVQNTNGSTGKGTGLFQVTQKGTPVGCETLGTPSGFTLVTTLNNVTSSGAAQYGPYFGRNVRVRPVTLTAGSQQRTVLVAAVSYTTGHGKLEIFILDPATGRVLDNTNIVGSQVQPHITVTYDHTATYGIGPLAAGDVNADGIPDFAGGDGNNTVFVFLGSKNANGILSYTAVPITPPASSPAGFGVVAMGNLPGVVGDAVVVGASGGQTTGGSAQAGVVYTYTFDHVTGGFDLIGTLDDPLPNPKNNDSFGKSVAIGDVTGDTVPDLIVGAPDATVNGVSEAGRVFVFPAALPSPYYTLTTGINNDQLGWKVGAGNVNGYPDVIATTGWNGSAIKVAIFGGPITMNSQSPTLTFLPDPRISATGWSSGFDAGDLLDTGQTEILVGVPNANNSSSCNVSVGAAELYFPSPSNLSQPTFTFQPPQVQSSYMGYGWGVALVTGVAGISGYTPLLLVGEDYNNLGSTNAAGQVYVYKNSP